MSSCISAIAQIALDIQSGLSFLLYSLINLLLYILIVCLLLFNVLLILMFYVAWFVPSVKLYNVPSNGMLVISWIMNGKQIAIPSINVIIIILYILYPFVFDGLFFFVVVLLHLQPACQSGKYLLFCAQMAVVDALFWFVRLFRTVVYCSVFMQLYNTLSDKSYTIACL